MLKVKEKYKGQTLTILGIGCVDLDKLAQPMLQVIQEKYPDKFVENAKPKKPAKDKADI